ncbi:MAG TPA: FHA domain-containing protein, partial [Acidobacteriota bacterium]|nr:FHA domain-containing protein [Acidobacteriota bacterium]
MTEDVKTKLTLRYTIDGNAFEVPVPPSGAEIGRAAECRLVIEDSEVSRHHARLSHEDGGWMITDLGSTNGTAVNGRELREPGPLSDGDVVTVHTYELAVGIEEDAGGGIVFDERDPDESVGTFIASADVLQLLEMGASEAVSAAEVTKAADKASADPAPAPGGLSVSSRSTLGANHVLELFSSAAEALLGAVGVEAVLEEIMRLAFDNVPAQRGAITLCEEEGEELRPVVVRGLEGEDQLRISRKIATGAVEEHKAFLIREVESDDRFTATDTIAQMDIRSAVCVPMEHDGQVQGLIYLDTRDVASRFGERDLRLVTVLGMLGAIGIRQTRYREEIAHQLQIRSRLERYSSPSVSSGCNRSVSTARCWPKSARSACSSRTYAGSPRFPSPWPQPTPHDSSTRSSSNSRRSFSPMRVRWTSSW